MLKYELDVAGAGLAEERRVRVWCCCVLEEEENGTGCGGVVILKMKAVEGADGRGDVGEGAGAGGWEPVVG